MSNVEKYRKNQYEYILSKKRVPCSDCGGLFPEVCMDFHHLDEETKENSLKKWRTSMSGRMRRWSKKRIDEELEKCVVICANCHRIRHFKIDNQDTP
jgi:hypothetical protein